MKKLVVAIVMTGLLLPELAYSQYRKKGEEEVRTDVQILLEEADSSEEPLVITLDQALQIALSENVSVKVADKEIERTGFAKKGTYASLFPQIDISGAYQRTIKKQVMYMDFDMSSIGGGMPGGDGETGEGSSDTLPQEVWIRAEALKSAAGIPGARGLRQRCLSSMRSFGKVSEFPGWMWNLLWKRRARHVLIW